MAITLKFEYNRKGNNKVELRIYSSDNRRNLYRSTGVVVEPEYWNAEKECISDKCKDRVLLQKKLDDFLKPYRELEMKCLLENIPFDSKAIENLEAAKAQPEAELYVGYATACIEMEYNTNKITDSTYRKYKNVMGRFAEFCKEVCGKDIRLNDFSREILDKFEVWLQKGHKQNTINKYLTVIKTYTDRARAEGKMTVNPFTNHKKAKAEKPKRPFLTEEELTRLESLELTNKIDRLVLDKFLFSCYCGLRISDNTDLLRSDIEEDAKYGMKIDKVMRKTKAHVSLPLHFLFEGKAERMIKRYIAEYPDLETVFPYVSDQTVNGHLKTIMAKANIDKEATSHTARHTCATLLAEKTGNPFVIMKVLGHSDIKESMTYIHNTYQSLMDGLVGVKW